MPAPLDVSRRQDLVLRATLGVMAPLVRLLLRHGVTYPTLARALKAVFVQVAEDEMKSQGLKCTDSALSLVTGVHRKDLRVQDDGERALAQAAPAGKAGDASASLVGQVVARWLTDRRLRQPHGAQPKPLPRSGKALSFDALVQAVSTDVRPRAMLDEMRRLGVVREDEEGLVHLVHAGFVPRGDWAVLTEALRLNLADHVEASVANLSLVQASEDTRWLEQAIFVDDISAGSVAHLQQTARAAWARAFEEVMAQAQIRFDLDQAQLPKAERGHRARFGVYFFGAPDDEGSPSKVKP